MRTIVISAVLAIALTVAACGSEGRDEGIDVVATTGILADVTTEVAGEDLAVAQLVPDGASPHDFQLSAEDRQRLEDADLIVANGSGLEAGIPLDELDTPVWELTANAPDPLPDDPHVWMDPTRVAAALPSLATALGDADPRAAAGFERRAGAYAAKLRELDRELRRTLAAVSEADREIVTSHDALGYFADRYGLAVAATAFPASGPEAEVSAARLQQVVAQVDRAGVPTVFASEEDDPATLRQVAAAAGVEIEEGLAIESLGDAGSYIEMLRLDAKLITSGLTEPG